MTMNDNVTAIVSRNSISLNINYEFFTLDSSHPNYYAVLDLIRLYRGYSLATIAQELRDLASVPAFIARKLAEDPSGELTIDDKSHIVYYKGTPLKGYDTERLIEMLRDGFDVTPLVNFIKRRQLNPLPGAVDELYLWLEKSNMPLTTDGCFLAYKKVNRNYTSIYDGRTMNAVGTTVSMARRELADSDRNRTCSAGLHFCSWDYLPCFGSSSGSRVVVVKVAPEDVVAIPNDYDNAKGRAWRYEVVSEVSEDKARQFFTDVPVVDTETLPTYMADVASMRSLMEELRKKVKEINDKVFDLDEKTMELLDTIDEMEFELEVIDDEETSF
jgi:hypothetical protein